MKKGSRLRRMILFNPGINIISVKIVYFKNGDREEMEFENTKGLRFDYCNYFIGWL